ncbi:helix-turn-helix transcriptional regulator [Streptomyces sp. NPDC048275]|uniref:helix-turn-helix transcriptional regulator n=1 Tax=Streptomyces sp. NPDC048275 TaxID=3155629 RepID=UPI0033C5220A
MLMALGLDQDTEVLYRTMLIHPTADLAAFCEILGRSEGAVRQALDRLSELGLVRNSYEEPGQLRAVSPELGLDLLLARQQAELAAQQQRIEASRAAAAQLIADYAQLRPAAAQPGVEQLVGIDAIRDRLAELTHDTRDEVMTFSPGHLSLEAIDAVKPLDEQLSNRGVTSRTVYLASARNSPRMAEYLAWLVNEGAHVRTVATLPTRMVIFDRSQAVIPVKCEDTADSAVLLTGEGNLAMLCAHFESVWDTAQPLSDKPRLDAHDLTDSERTTLKLLSVGHTDETIAKRLGVSHRTARRIATSLMERLSARSRFEAGVQAVKHGWL